MKNQLQAANLDEKVLKRQMAIIDSMTPRERPQPRSAEGEPQAPHRGRLGHQARGHQPLAEDAPRHGRHDEGDERRQARADGRARADDGLRRRHAEPEEMAKLAEKMPGGLPPGNARRASRRACREDARPAAEFPRTFPAWAETAGLGDSRPGKEEIAIIEHEKGNRMSLKIRLARAGTKKRPSITS
jgi:hypothetical protein